MAVTPLMSRAQCGLRPPARGYTPLNAQGNTAHYGGPSPWGSGPDRSSPARFAATTDHNRCASIWRAYQAFHIDQRKWADIAYSSGICPHGVRLEGRGPGRRTGAQGSPGNERSHATCYIAGEGDPLTDGAKLAYLDEEARLGVLRWNHQDWMSTACAGNPIRAWLRAGKPRPGAIKPPTAPPTLPPRPQESFLMSLSSAQQNAILSNSANSAAWSLMTLAEIRETKATAHRCELRIMNNGNLIREVITSGKFTQAQAKLFDQRLREENEKLMEEIKKIDAQCDKDAAKLRAQAEEILAEGEAA